MRINDLKEHLSELIETAYETALAEGHQEIIHPFRIEVHPDGTVDYAPLRSRSQEIIHK